MILSVSVSRPCASKCEIFHSNGSLRSVPEAARWCRSRAEPGHFGIRRNVERHDHVVRRHVAGVAQLDREHCRFADQHLVRAGGLDAQHRTLSREQNLRFMTALGVIGDLRTLRKLRTLNDRLGRRLLAHGRGDVGPNAAGQPRRGRRR